MKQLTNSEIISKLPAYIVEEAKMHLRYGIPSHVIRRNGRLEVVDSLRSGYHTDDERFVCTITDKDVFSETEQIENYINLYHKYPANYHGIRDEAVLDSLDKDMSFDAETGTISIPKGEIIGENFVYLGKTSKF